MRRKTKSIIASVVACACVGVAGFALAGGFSPKTENRDYSKTDSNYTQNVEGISYTMSSNVEGVTYELSDPLIVNDTYYFTLEEPAEAPTGTTGSESNTVKFTFSHFEYNYGTAELISEDPIKFRLKVSAKDVPLLKIVAVFKSESSIKPDNGTVTV